MKEPPHVSRGESILEEEDVLYVFEGFLQVLANKGIAGR
jgi:hypothetical protein